ncbi:MAG: hypothetical protein BJ554DRAFT_2725 [Olpidium bornovanus]|uniref:Uncharacterized protein n=1 Tax=Olpidium bornovanus TaxID=278681 RepID=A0A8H7ZPZ3_9FUNG|nr:MAG: hypothetical protein BJ554DRAFT_2725 [Olpidium bornovanus]
MATPSDVLAVISRPPGPRCAAGRRLPALVRLLFAHPVGGASAAAPPPSAAGRRRRRHPRRPARRRRPFTPTPAPPRRRLRRLTALAFPETPPPFSLAPRSRRALRLALKSKVRAAGPAKVVSPGAGGGADAHGPRGRDASRKGSGGQRGPDRGWPGRRRQAGAGAGSHHDAVGVRADRRRALARERREELDRRGPRGAPRARPEGARPALGRRRRRRFLAAGRAAADAGARGGGRPPRALRPRRRPGPLGPGPHRPARRPGRPLRAPQVRRPASPAGDRLRPRRGRPRRAPPRRHREGARPGLLRPGLPAGRAGRGRPLPAGLRRAPVEMLALSRQLLQRPGVGFPGPRRGRAGRLSARRPGAPAGPRRPARGVPRVGRQARGRAPGDRPARPPSHGGHRFRPQGRARPLGTPSGRFPPTLPREVRRLRPGTRRRNRACPPELAPGRRKVNETWEGRFFLVGIAGGTGGTAKNSMRPGVLALTQPPGRRTFDLANFPDQLDATANNLKPVLITDVLREIGGLVLWVTPGAKLPSPLHRVWDAIARRGVYALGTPGGVEIE